MISSQDNQGSSRQETKYNIKQMKSIVGTLIKESDHFYLIILAIDNSFTMTYIDHLSRKIRHYSFETETRLQTYLNKYRPKW